MSNTLPLLNGIATLDQALRDDDNILVQIKYPQRRREFWNYLYTQKAKIESIVSFHLRVPNCRVGDMNTWMSGSYNVCIPVLIYTPLKVFRVLVRITLSYKVGETGCPGNVDEKLRCEAASYIWMQENSPDSPIPFLYGFGFPGGQTFTAPENVSFLSRLKWNTNRLFRSWFRFPTPCRYVCQRCPDSLQTGYVIISYITNGNKLSDSWESRRHEKPHRTNLFHGLAKIILSLHKSPLSRIGSLTLNNQGVISLTNRPLTLTLQTLENEGIPSSIKRNYTYSAVDLYLLDILACHDNRILYQPNSIHNEADGQQQLATITIMRAILPHFINHSYRYRPFFFTLIDLHQNNIFVDDDWNITGLIDLEWACSLPIESQEPPYWISGRAIDDIEHGEPLDTFSQIVAEFLDAFEQEERDIVGEDLYQTPIMRKCWETGSFWYFQAINSPKGLCAVFTEHIQPLFCFEHSKSQLFDKIVAPY